MVLVELAVRSVDFPAMRLEIVGALASLADREYQERAWLLQRFEVPGRFEDLDLVIHILYDDTEVLPDPHSGIGAVLFEGEAPALQNLGIRLSPLLARLGDSPAEMYLASAEWDSVVSAAGVALATMIRHGAFT